MHLSQTALCCLDQYKSKLLTQVQDGAASVAINSLMQSEQDTTPVCEYSYSQKREATENIAVLDSDKHVGDADYILDSAVLT